jgi:putative transposase
VFRLSRTAYYYVGDEAEDGNVKNRLLELAYQYPSFGYWKLYYMLRDEGYIVNHKKVYRLYTALGLKGRCNVNQNS